MQYQVYDITNLVQDQNNLSVLVGKGWMRSPMPGWVDSKDKHIRAARPCGMIAELHIVYEDGSEDIIATDTSWEYTQSQIRFSEIYDGEIFDATVITDNWEKAKLLEWPKEILIPQEGEEIRELERVAVKEILHTPKGETVIDFGQEVTGYVEFSVKGRKGDLVSFIHGEMLDKFGNLYNDNYRSAEAHVKYICNEGTQIWHPQLTFFGFRYIKLLQFPGKAKASDFTAIQVRSDIKRTGYLGSSSEKLNQLFSNIIWGQRDNFLDVPTDCPQRDERLGWTGDAQVFVKAASYNYDVERFFAKWLHDLAADQREDGAVGQVIPDYLPNDLSSAAWGDAAVICPWQIYMTYGNAKVLEDQFESMCKWVDYITETTTTKNLWTEAPHCFGDWLGLDAPSGSYKGSSRDELICSAFYAYSTELLVKAGKVLNRDMTEYEGLHHKIVQAFQEKFTDFRTQTEHVLAVHFGLAANPQKVADELANMILKDGLQIRTGFVGTPYILHVLSDYGHTDIAYSLLLREKFPSWLFSVNQGASTIWEHWDGMMENGEFWCTDMNSFNHYAYGSVADWVYEKAAGICPMKAGFEKIKIAPHPDRRLRWLEASIETRQGLVSVKWSYYEDQVKYEIITPVEAVVIIDGAEYEVKKGEYIFWSNTINQKHTRF